MNASRFLSFTVLGVAFAAGSAQALTRSESDAGHRFVTGGIGDGEVQRLKSERGQYSLWAITAAKGSGAYLADVQVRITETASGHVAFEGRLDGPFLMVDLPPGRYTVEARHEDQLQRKNTRIGTAGLRQMVFYFDMPSADEASPAERQAAAR